VLRKCAGDPGDNRGFARFVGVSDEIDGAFEIEGSGFGKLGFQDSAGFFRGCDRNLARGLGNLDRGHALLTISLNRFDKRQPGVNIGFPTGLRAAAEREKRGSGDHGRIIGAKRELGIEDRKIGVRRLRLDSRPERRIRGDPAREHKRFRTMFLRYSHCFSCEHVDDGVLIRSGEICHR
jgi:hypothetical protein